MRTNRWSLVGIFSIMTLVLTGVEAMGGGTKPPVFVGKYNMGAARTVVPSVSATGIPKNLNLTGAQLGNVRNVLTAAANCMTIQQYELICPEAQYATTTDCLNQTTAFYKVLSQYDGAGNYLPPDGQKVINMILSYQSLCGEKKATECRNEMNLNPPGCPHVEIPVANFGDGTNPGGGGVGDPGP